MDLHIDLSAWTDPLLRWAREHLASTPSLVALGLALGLLVLGHLLGAMLRKRLQARFSLFLEGRRFRNIAALRLLSLVGPVIGLVFLLLAQTAYRQLELDVFVLRIFTSLVGAWVGAVLAASLIHTQVWRRFVAMIVWFVAALNILGILGPAIEILDGAAIQFHEFRLSLWTLVKGGVLLGLLVSLGLWLTELLEQRINRTEGLTPSTRVLMAKVAKVFIMIMAGLLSLQIVGVDLSALAVLGGAVGLGVGFGLQKIFSNLISGFILLMDRSIKPGDVIQLGEVYGWITRLQARYVSVVTRDGTEYLIPNEDLITGQVVNWSYTNTNVRLKIPVGVAYESDVDLAMRLIREAGIESARENGRVLRDPEPMPLLLGFGDSSVDLELRIWISDPQNGLANVQSDVLLRIWHKFKEHGVTIPFPQRDVHLDIGGRDLPSILSPSTGSGNTDDS